MRTTAIMNLKGGTGKTVTAINMAAILAKDYDQRVLLVDADSQANLTQFTAPNLVMMGGLADLLCQREAFAYPTTIKGVKIIPANDDLIGLDVSAVTRGVAEPMALRYFLDDNADRFDWCIIDCPPAFSAGAMAAIAAADELVVPMKVDAFGVNGVKSLMAMLENMRRINPDLELAGVLPTMVYQDKQQLEALNVLRTQLGIAAARTFRSIRRSPLVDRSTFSQEPLIYCSPKSKTLYDYRVFVHQLIGDQEGGED